MLEAKLTIACPDLAALTAAIVTLVRGTAPAPAVPNPQASADLPPKPFAPPPAAPAQFVPPPTAPAMPPMQPPVAPTPAYTLDQIMNAGAALASSSPENAQKAMGLLTQFGVQSVTELKNEQLGAFATALRGLGARI